MASKGRQCMELAPSRLRRAVSEARRLERAGGPSSAMKSCTVARGLTEVRAGSCIVIAATSEPHGRMQLHSGAVRVLATGATIRPPAITHDGTEVRLRLEGGKE